MTREELFADVSRDEKGYYNQMVENGEDEVLLPVTKEGFQTLVDIAAKPHNLPVYDKLYVQAASYVHSIEKDVDTILISTLTRILRKVASNDLTWELIEEVRRELKANEEKKLQLVTNEPS